MLHYNGPKKVNPPSVSNHIGQPFKDVCKLNESVTQAHSADMKWLLTLFNTDGEEYPLEWSGYITVLARDHHVTSSKPCPHSHLVTGSPLITSFIFIMFSDDLSIMLS